MPMCYLGVVCGLLGLGHLAEQVSQKGRDALVKFIINKCEMFQFSVGKKFRSAAAAWASATVMGEEFAT